MADIFISYSRKDSKQALSLAERLRSAGISVWIDQHGLEAATSWSKEIVEAIESAKVFIILLSGSSLASKNVVKELSIASESERSILPIELEPTSIPAEFKYQLAGLQRAQYSDFEALIRALAKIGVLPGSPISVPPKRIVPTKRKRNMYIGVQLAFLALVLGTYFLFFAKKHSGPIASNDVKSLAVLPFESLSSDKENEYFADGMTATLIDILVPLEGLRVVDRRSSMEFKGAKKDIKSIAATLGVRYLVDGTIQRQSDKFGITVQVTDAESGKILMSKTFEGTTQDLMGIQLKMAKQIVLDLQLALNENAIVRLPESATSNPEAFNLCMLAGSEEYDDHQDSALIHLLQATKLDSTYAFAYLNIANIYANLKLELPDSAAAARVLFLADSFFAIGNRLDTFHVFSHFVASWIAHQRGNYELSIREAKLNLAKSPDYARGYSVLALAYNELGRHELAASNLEEALKRNPLGEESMYSLLLTLMDLRDTVRLKKYAEEAVTIFKAAILRHPNNRMRWLGLPLALVLTGKGEEASQLLDEILKRPDTDGRNYSWAAGMNALAGRHTHAMELLKKAVAMGGILKFDFTWKFFDNMRSLPEFQTLVKQQAEAKAKMKGKLNG